MSRPLGWLLIAALTLGACGHYGEPRRSPEAAPPEAPQPEADEREDGEEQPE